MRWAAVIGAGLLLAVLGVVLLWSTTPPSDAERANALAAELRCPDCQGLSVADSHTAAAVEIRRQIAELVAGGATDDEVRDHFTARYGTWILLGTDAPALWLLPLAVVVVAGAGLVTWIVRRSHRTDEGAGAPARPLSEEERRRIHEEAEALDA